MQRELPGSLDDFALPAESYRQHKTHGVTLGFSEEDHDKYLWTNASYAFAANMVKSFIANGWCVQIRGPQAGGAVTDLPIHLYDLGTGNQVKIPSEVMIPETREFEFANLGFIPLSYYKNRDYACFFSANSAQKINPCGTPLMMK